MKSLADTKPKTVADLMRVTGLGRDTVRAEIRTGELPGYHIGRQYTVPADAFVLFCRGEWVPKVRPIFTEQIRPIPNPIRSLKKGA